MCTGLIRRFPKFQKQFDVKGSSWPFSMASVFVCDLPEKQNSSSSGPSTTKGMDIGYG